MKSRIHNAITNDDGMTTAEYAVGTVAAAGLGGLLLKMLTSPEVQDLIWKIVQQAFRGRPPSRLRGFHIRRYGHLHQP